MARTGSVVAQVGSLVAGSLVGPTLLVPADAEPLAQALESAVKRENYALLQRSAALEYARDEALCKKSADRPCCDQLARRYAVDYVLDVNIAREAENWNFDMALRDVQVEGAASQADLHCAGCNNVKAAARLAEIATQVLGQAAGKGRGTLAVSSTPSGAKRSVSPTGNQPLPLCPCTLIA